VSGLQLPYATYLGVLEDAGIDLAPAELHGGMTGALSVGGLPAAFAWVQQCAADSGRPLAGAAEEDLRALAVATLERLEGIELGFEPLLPDDAVDLEQRVEALALWCHGFLAGLAVAGLGSDAPLAPVLEEIVADFSEVSRAQLAAGERDTERQSEFDFLQLAEYVRAGAQLAFEELAATRGAEAAARGVHH